MKWRLTTYIVVALVTTVFAKTLTKNNDTHLQDNSEQDQSINKKDGNECNSGTGSNGLCTDTKNKSIIVNNGNGSDDNNGDNGNGSDDNNGDNGNDSNDDNNGSDGNNGDNGNDSNDDNNGSDGNDGNNGSDDNNGDNGNGSDDNNGDNGNDSNDDNNGSDGNDDNNGSDGNDDNNGSDGNDSNDDNDGSDGNDDKDDNGGSENATSTEATTTESDGKYIPDNTIQTENGPVRGFLLHNTLHIQSFIDIPYGAFRESFEAPVQPNSWEEPLENIQHDKRCPQLEYPDDTYVGDLDCLTLSVFRPLNVTKASVLFHIHEGNFISGSGDPSLYGPEYLVSRGVILVLPNYRLGPLGFLCLQNATAPGNAALKDLALALNWTRNNIEKFGGDPSNIVVSGDGTSGALVSYLALSPMSKEYISKAILESGSVLSHWAIDRNPLVTATKLVEALVKKNVQYHSNIFTETTVATLVKEAKGILFRPCVETGTEAFMSKTPWQILQNDEINISFMIGSANHAGLQEAVSHTEASLIELNENVENFLPNDLKFKNGEEQKLQVARKIKKMYFGEKNVSIDDLRDLSHYYTDASYLGPGVRAARYLIDANATVYLYEFAYVGTLNRELVAINKPLEGAARGDLMGYLFSQDEVPVVVTEADINMVNLMSKLWISFIETGQPTAENIEWNKLENTEESEEEWLSIDFDVKLEKGLHLERLQLWTEIYNEHFIERSQASDAKSSLYSVLIAIMILLNFV